MSSKQEKRKRHWILEMCHLNDKYGGLSMQDLYTQQSKDLEISYGEIDLILKDLNKRGLLKPQSKPGWAVHFYKITEEGKKELAKLNYNDAEFHKLLSLMPLEYLKIRVINVENFILWGTFAFMSYTTAIFSRQWSTSWALVFFGLSFLLMPVAIGYFMRVLTPHLINFSERLFKKTAFVMKMQSGVIAGMFTTILLIIAIIIENFAKIKVL